MGWREIGQTSLIAVIFSGFAVGAAAPSKNFAVTSSAIQLKVDKFTMENGLTVLLHVDNTLPIVSYQTWFRVGSRNEEVGYTGLAHLFEHLMFKGSKRYSGKDFDRILHANGATNNAFTSHDYTGYYENLPSDKLELVMDIEADRMAHLSITPEHLKSERDVVKEERRFRVDNDVEGTLSEMMWSTVFKVHPYRSPISGSLRDLDRVTVEKAQDFYRQYYAPNNAVIVVAGAFDPGQVKSWLKKYYGTIPAQKIENRAISQEPAQRGARSMRLAREVKNSTFLVAFRAPKAGDPDAYALDLLASVLGEGGSSRLYKRLVYREQLATAVFASNYSLRDPGVFQVFVSLRPGAQYQKAANLIYAELWQVRNKPVVELELIKARNMVMKHYIEGLKTIAGKAHALALNEIIFGDYTMFFRDLAEYEKVTVADLQRVAKTYLQPQQRSVVLVAPKAAEEIQP